MDIKDLKLLLALARHRHFARAAQACHISQPAFSERIRNLEAEFAVPLVLRGHRFEGFTADGDRALAWAREILAGVDGLTQDMAVAHHRLSGRLRLGVVPTAATRGGILADAYKARYPDVDIILLTATSNDIQRSIESFEMEAGLTYLDNEQLRGVQSQPLYREEYVLVGPKPALPGPAAAISWADAGRLPLAFLIPEMQNRRIVDAAFAQAGVQPAVHFETNSLSAIAGALVAGRMAAVLPDSFADRLALGTELATKRLVQPTIAHSVGVIIIDRPVVPPVAAALIRLARESGPGGPVPKLIG